MPTVALHTLGCKLNFAETGTIARQFEQRDFTVVPFGAEADVVVINTCTVTNEADRKCRQMIRKAIRSSPRSFVIVTGCYAQLRPQEVANIAGVDAVLGTAEKHQIFSLINSFDRVDRTQVEVSCIDAVSSFGPAFSGTERTRAFLKIQDGCDYSCSFCTIPMARGRSRSQSVSATVKQAESIAAAGFREIVLSGVNLGLYGSDTGETLMQLLPALDATDGIERFRISSIEPNLLTDEIIDFVAESRSFAPHFHLPLQSGDDFVLGSMRRRYRRGLYRDRVEKIKGVLPEAAIGVDVIVGFPSETLERFDATVSFLTDLPVSYLHVFTYSERDGTAAAASIESGATLPVEPSERSRRNRVLRLVSEKKRHRFYHEHLETVRSVLWEGADRDGHAYGFTDNYIRVRTDFDPALEGTVGNVYLNRIEDGVVTVGATDDALIRIA